MNEVPRLQLARLPTPLVPLDRLSDRLKGPRIWLKRDDLTDTVASGNKLRKLEYTVARALDEKADVLITCGGIQSNHCRATALVASQLGLASHLLLRGNEPDDPDGNLLLDRLLGAEITYLTREEYQHLESHMDRIAERYRAEGRTPYKIPVGASDETGLWGYINCCLELKNQFQELNVQPGCLLSATGSGGTLGGLIIGNTLHDLGCEVLAFNVCDDEDYFVTKIAEDFQAFSERYGTEIDLKSLPINVIDGYVGPGYGRATPDVFETIRDVARLEGVILDPVYTGKAFNAMLQEIPRGRFDAVSDIVFIHTGGIYGNFPQRAQFIF